MTRRTRDLKLIAKDMEKWVFEMFGPFVQVVGRPVGPSDVVKTVAALARLRAVDTTEMARTIRGNLKHLVAD